MNRTPATVTPNRRPVLRFAVLAALVTSSVVWAATEEWKAPSFRARKKNPIAATAESIAAGKLLYVKECQSCHGPAGKGDGPAAKDLETQPGDLSSPNVAAQSDGALFWKISTGRSPMPAMDTLMSEQQRWQVVNYVRTLAQSAATPPRYAVPAAYRQAVSRVIGPYIELTTALSAAEPEVTAAQVNALRAAARNAAAMKEDPEVEDVPEAAWALWRTATERVLTSAGALDQDGLEAAKLRPRLGTLSAAMVNIVGLFGHAEPAPLAILRCDKDADQAGPLWLQADAEPRNPYAEDAQQRQCGTVVSRLAPAASPENSKP